MQKQGINPAADCHDRRYRLMAGQGHRSHAPSPWVAEHLSRITAGGQVLDLACGNGRHTRLLQEQGYPVVAADIDLSGVEDLQNTPGIELAEMDLEQPDWPFAGSLFAGIIVCNYLYRPHLSKLADNLSTGGVLIYETFATGNELYGKPSNPDFLLRRNELRDVFSVSLDILAFEHGLIKTPGKRIIQRICATKPA